MLRLLLACGLAAALALPAAAQRPGQIFGYVTETSTGPYVVGSTFEATLVLYAGAGTPVSVGTSTMVVDYNRAAMTFPTFTQPRQAGTDFVWLRYDGVRTSLGGGIAAYTADVRPNNVFDNRITLFTDLGFTSDAGQEGEALPATPTEVVRLRFTVVDPTQPFTITPRSQQWFDGPGGPTGAYLTGGFDGLSVVQRQITGGAGWRMLGTPAPTATVPLNPLGELTVAQLAAQNLVQGLPGFFPTAGTNLFAGYTGSAFGAAPATLPGGTGLLWYLYNQTIATGGPSTSVALPFTLTTRGPTGLALLPGADLTPNTATVALHASGDRWNLVANPAPFAIDPADITPVGGAFTSAIVQVWDPNPGTYRLASDPALGGGIAAGQGMMLENASATAFAVPATALVGSAAPVRSAADSLVARVAFALDGPDAGAGAVADRAAILELRPDASAGWDLRDAGKLVPPAEAYALVAFVGELAGEPRLKAQESRPAAEPATVPVDVRAVGVSGTFTLSWTLDELPDDLGIGLRDTHTGAVVDLRADARYAFEMEADAPARSALEALPAEARVAAAAPRFELLLGQSIVPAEGSAPVTDLALDAPAPNPFAGATTLRFALPEPGVARLSVLDVLGREVAVLADGAHAAGRHEVRLDGRALAAGVYVVRLDADGRTISRRVTRAR